MTKTRKQIFQISERKSFKTVWFSGFLLKNIQAAIYFYAYFYLYGVWTVLSIIRHNKKSNLIIISNNNNNNKQNANKIDKKQLSQC